MRTASYLKKSVLENIRDWKIFLMTLLMAPVYVIITYLFFGVGDQTYKIIIYNQDKPVILEDGSRFEAGTNMAKELGKLKQADGKSIVDISFENDFTKAEKHIKDKSADLFVVFPEDFSQLLRSSMKDSGKTKAQLSMTGDESNPKCQMAAAFFDSTAYEYISKITGVEIPLNIIRKPLNNSISPTQFGGYVPGLLAVSLMSLFFTGAASLIKEVDKGTIRRIKISRIKPFEFIAANSITQAIISIPVLLLTYVTALLFGYEPVGSLLLILMVGIISSFSIMAISLILSSFLSTVNGLITIGSFPYFILLFFSGAWFPMPGNNLFHIGSYSISATDLLPVAHTVSAFNKILNYGSKLVDVIPELTAIIILTVVYFTAGIWLFNRKHMRAA
ncbi:MAG: ABC transporter permease [Bacillota bacterium]|nr:ABC transporter permease [Bacillota bacterium]